jgi:hypothetical protein
MLTRPSGESRGIHMRGRLSITTAEKACSIASGHPLRHSLSRLRRPFSAPWLSRAHCTSCWKRSTWGRGKHLGGGGEGQVRVRRGGHTDMYGYGL